MSKKFTGGYLDSLSPEQSQTLSTMKDRFKDWIAKVAQWGGSFVLDDRTFLKFLRARDFGIEAASDMLTKTLEFRDQWKPHEIKSTDEDVKEALETGIWRLVGKSKKGCPIQLIQVGLFDPKEVKSADQYMRSVLYYRETTNKAMAEEGWVVETSVVMFDMNGWGLFKQGTPTGMRYTQMLIDTVQKHYPEVLETAIVFNAPFVFRIAWNIIKPWLDPHTANRVLFVTDAKKLHEMIDPEVLNERYLGTRKEEYPIPGL